MGGGIVSLNPMIENPLYGLTIGELKAALAEMPESWDNRVVVLARDPEGNGFDTLGEIAVGWYRDVDEPTFRGISPTDDETWEHAESEATKGYVVDEDTDEEFDLDADDHPVICLWP